MELKSKYRKEINQSYRRKQVICVILGVCIALVLTAVIVGRRMEQVEAKVSETQQSLAGEVFRFHVLANSDSDEDQAVKLQVRDAVIAYMRESMEAEADRESEMKSDREPETESGADDTRAWAASHLEEIEEIADQVLAEEGFHYASEAEVTTCYFPDKRYGDILFPEGNYQALRIKLGKADGHNWWCVLYPNLCFTSTTCAVVDEDGKKDLEEALSAEEYEMVTATSEFKIKWFFFGDASKEK